jgi:sulfite reductase alpha subunit-like flavoprotein
LPDRNRLYKLPYPPAGNPQWRPGFLRRITNNVVYDRLAPRLLPELKKMASKQERKTRLHQHLTQDVGHPKLLSHMGSIVTLLKLSKTPEQFYSLVDQLHPRFNTTGQLDFDSPPEN